MYTRFEHEIDLNQPSYDKIVRAYADPTNPPLYPAEISPSFLDTTKDSMRRAGNLLIVSAMPDSFTASWSVSDGNTSRDRAYEDMLVQNGIDVIDSDTLYAYSYRQHLVGGIRVEEDTFAVTSLFDQDAYKFNGRKMSEAKQIKAGEALRGLFIGNMPYPHDFDYKQFMAAARIFRLKQAKK